MSIEYAVMYIENVMLNHDDTILAAEATVICRMREKILQERMQMEVVTNKTSGRKFWCKVGETIGEELCRDARFPETTQWHHDVIEAMHAAFPV